MRIRLPQTNFGPLFASWDGTAITLTDDCPSVEALYEQALAHCNDSTLDDSPLTSPLTSPLSTPPSSRPASPLLQGPEPADNSPNELQAASRPGRKRRRKGYSKVARKRRREHEHEPAAGPSAAARAKYIEPSASRAVHVGYDAGQAPTTSTAFTAAPQSSTREREYTLSDLTGPNAPRPFRLCKWDGRKTVPIIDSENRAIVVLAGQPDDPTWPQVHERAAAALDNARVQLNTPKRGRKRKFKPHRRGNFHVYNDGISHGGGQKHPKNLHHNAMTQSVLDGLKADSSIIRIAHFASAVFAAWAPRLFTYYLIAFNALLASDSSLVRNFTSSIWATIAFNLGPRTITWRHRDFLNLPFGWCCITALGRFDYKKGGHLVLWELGLIIEFPPGATILIPSAIIEHSNIRILPGETRYSLTQYTAGGLFRWVENDFQTQDMQREGLDEEGLRRVQQKNERRWADGLSYFSTLDELRAT